MTNEELVAKIQAGERDRLRMQILGRRANTPRG